MNDISPFPIFDSAKYYREKTWLEGPLRANASTKLSTLAKKTNEDNVDWSVDYLQLADAFLRKYLAPKRSENTFNRFKVELERFTLWTVHEHKGSPYLLTADEITDYLEFIMVPKADWVSACNTPRTIVYKGSLVVNPGWRPFWARRPKGESAKLPSINSPNKMDRELRIKLDNELISSYRPSLSTAQAALRALGAFFTYVSNKERLKDIKNKKLIARPGLEEDLMNVGNPVPEASKAFLQNYSASNDYLAKGAEHRLTQQQWSWIIDALKSLRDDEGATELQRKKWVRGLFIMTFLKANMLRVSEICKTQVFNPKMGDIEHRVLPNEGMDYWEYSLVGKGNKRRKVILPEGLLSYLQDYRESRGLLTPMPHAQDKAPLLAQLKPVSANDNGDPIERALSYAGTCDQVQLMFDKSVEYLKALRDERDQPFTEDIQALKSASTHWLRHTGASMALEDNENLKDVADTLGHSDQRITDQIYNRREEALRAESATKRRV